MAWQHRPAAAPLVRLLLTLACLLQAIVSPAMAQSYTTVVVFGDSLSDTGNDAAVSLQTLGSAFAFPAPSTGFTAGRFTDGADTVPKARAYTGVWVEQLAARLPNSPAVQASLAGGSNYAYGGATAVGATGTLNPGTPYAITIHQLGQQVADYLATRPILGPDTLIVIWCGTNDIFSSPTTGAAAADRVTAVVQQMVNAGATQFLIANLPPLGQIPLDKASATQAASFSTGTGVFNTELATSLVNLQALNADRSLRISILDTFSLYRAALTTPSAFGLTNVTGTAQFNTAANPDTYLFWDGVHPTTAGHQLLAIAALATLGPAVATSTALATSNPATSLNTPLSLTATVSAATGTPQGSVVFSDGTATLGISPVSGTGATATGTFTTNALAGGAHRLSSTFFGINGYLNSTSPAIVETVTTPPTYAVSAAPTAFGFASGGSGSTLVTVTPSGGYTGTFTVSCDSLAPTLTCSAAPATLAVTGTAAVSSTVTLTSRATATIQPLATPGSAGLIAACGLPLFAALCLRRRPRHAMLASLTVFAGLGCGAGVRTSSTPSATTYQVPVIVTPAAGAPTTVTLSVTLT